MKKLTAIILMLIGAVSLSLCVCAQPYEGIFSVTVLPDQYVVDVTWSLEKAENGADSVAVSLFEDDSAEPCVSGEYAVGQGSVSLLYDQKATKLRVVLDANYNGVNVYTQEKIIDLTQVPISVPSGQFFNSLIFPLEYRNMEQEQDVIDITVNGESIQKSLSQSGCLKTELSEGVNDFDALFTDTEQGISWRIVRQINVDRVSPILKMSKDYDGMATDFNKVTLCGIVYDGDGVTVNGVEAKLDENGIFSAVVPLKKGENTVTVVAFDVSGNQTLYTASVKCGKLNLNSVENKINADKAQKMNFDEILSSNSSFWALVISGVLCVAVVAYAFVFWRKEGK